MTTTESTVAADLEVAPVAEDESQAPAGGPLLGAEISSLIEALLFVADGPVEEPALARALGLTRRQIEAPLNALAEALRDRGVRLQRGPDGVQLVTAPAAATYIEQFLGLEAARRLSPAALETLAIIAYRQPVTRGTLEAIRGVSCDGPIDTLRARGLIDVAGRADSPGRPALFATTQKFLEHFGLERAEDLPALPPEVAELAASLPERAEQLALDAIAAIAPASEVMSPFEGTPVSEPQAAPVEVDVESVPLARPLFPSVLPDLPGGLPMSRPFAPPSGSGVVLPPSNGGLPLGG